MSKRRYLPLDDRFWIFRDGLERVERGGGHLSAALASQNGFEHLLQTVVPIALRDELGLRLGRTTGTPGVQLSQRRVIPGTGVGPVDIVATGSAGARSMILMELSGLMSRGGPARAVRKLRKDIVKLRRLSLHPDFHRGSALIAGLGFTDSDRFQDWVSAAARSHPWEATFFPLRRGGFACVAIVEVHRWCVPDRTRR